MLENTPTSEDVRELWDYVHGEAQNYHGMTYAEGIGAVLNWLEGNTERPDKEE